MTLSKRTTLGVALGVIFLSWIRDLITGFADQQVPATFRELVLGVVLVKLVVLAVIFLLLRLEGERFDALGVSRDQWPRRIGAGLLIGLAMFVGLNVAFTAVMNALIPAPPATGPTITTFFKDPAHLLAFLPIGIFGGGVVEELQRIFVLTRFEKWLGRPGLFLGLALTSVMFGVGHLYQGVGSAVSVAVSGLVFGLVYLRRRSALEPIAAHAFSNVLAMVAATMLAK
ncbi:MAG TPA: CPBP family intramembrane glutamic endopeptidase [Gemmatimonadales bacterium]|nr:CPBP family intramembrane glutamic endopeptidase [Gemmatimonadales bacterium]